MMTVNNNNNNNENNATSVKLTFDGQMRRFPFYGTSFAALKEQVVGLLGLEKTADIRLQYTDEEGDLITISSDLELKSAIVGGQLLRVVATRATGAAPASPAESAPEETPFPQGADAFRSFPCGRGMGGFGQRGAWGRGGMGAWGQRGGMGGWGRGGMGGWGQRGGMSGCGRGGMAGGWDKDSKKEYKKQHKEEYEAHKEVHKALKEAHKEAHKEHRKMWKDLPKEERKMWKHQMKHAGPPHFGGPAGPHGFPPGPPPPFGGPAEAHSFPPGPHHEHFGGGPMGPHGGPHGGPRHGPWGGHHHHHHAHFGGDMGPFARGEGCDQKIIARFVKDVTIPDGTELAAGIPFVKTWRLRNEGTDAWPAGVVLCFVGKHSDDLGGPETVPAVDGAVAPGQDVDVSVALVAPTKPGRYTGYWRMCTAEGRKFGQRVWVSIIVPGSSSSSEGEKESDKYEALVDVVLANEQLRSFGVKRHRVFRLLSRFGGDTEKVTAVLTEKVNKKLGKRDRADFMKM